MGKEPICIGKNGTLKRKQNTLVFCFKEASNDKDSGDEQKEQKIYFPIESIEELFLMGEVELNKRVLEFLSENGVVIHFFSRYGRWIGSFLPQNKRFSGFTFLKQVEAYNDMSKRIFIAQEMVRGSVKNMLSVIQYYIRRKKGESKAFLEEKRDAIKSYLSKVEETTTIEELLALEGNSREAYYSCFDYIICDDDFPFEKRTKRPPQNYLNTLISFGNTLLYCVCLNEIFHTHLDPRVSFLHSTNFRPFSLNLDIADIFKPLIVDRTIFSLINKKSIKAKHFEKGLEGIYMNKEGKGIFLEAFNNRMKETIYYKKLKRRVSYRTLIRLELYKLEKFLLGEGEYKAFVLPW